MTTLVNKVHALFDLLFLARLKPSSIIILFLFGLLFAWSTKPAFSQEQVFDIYEGVVRLPEGFIASGDEQITITAESVEFFSTTLEFSAVIQVGQNEGAFSFLLNRDDAPVFWELSLVCENCNADIATGTHFPTTPTGDPLILEDIPFAYAVGQNFRDLVLTFISTRPPEQPMGDAGAASILVPTIDLLLNDD